MQLIKDPVAWVTVVVQVQSLAWEFPHAVGEAKKKKKSVFRNTLLYLSIIASVISWGLKSTVCIYLFKLGNLNKYPLVD